MQFPDPEIEECSSMYMPRWLAVAILNVFGYACVGGILFLIWLLLPPIVIFAMGGVLIVFGLVIWASESLSYHDGDDENYYEGL